MFNNHVINFPIDDFNSILLNMKNAANKKPLWRGTVFVGNTPIYMEIHIKTIAAKIERYFIRTLPDVCVDGAKKLYVLNDGVDAFAKRPKNSVDYSCFLTSDTTIRPQLIVCNNCIFIHNSDEFFISLDDTEYNFRFIGENHLMMKLFNYILDDSVVLHGAVVGTDDFGVLITGLSGAGKSTLAAHCLAQGVKFVGDDRIAINRVNDDIFANPVYTTISLYNTMDGIKIIGTDVQSTSDKRNYILDKSQISHNIKIKSVIEPVATHARTPLIIPHKKQYILNKICMDYSNFSLIAKSTNVFKDYERISRLLNGCGYNIIELSESIESNAKRIVDFIKTKGAN